MDSDKIAQHIASHNYLKLYWAIKRSEDPRREVALALKATTLGRVTDFIIALIEMWYNQKIQLDAAQDALDVGEV
jgi:hypothetical protein